MDGSDVLVLGGTVFVGRAMVAEAQAAGAHVTVFHRGVSGVAPDGTDQVLGDRTDAGDLEQLAGRHFDLVLDTSGYVPADVGLAARLLAPTCGHYVVVSSVNAHPGWPARTDYEDEIFDGRPDATRDDVPPELDEAGPYGWLKVGCERAVERAFGPQRTTVLRAGAIVGPWDGVVGRLPWWIDRVARAAGGGEPDEVLVPGAPDAPVSLIDARDLARFALAAVPGVFETPGPARDTRADLMAACTAATGCDPTLTWVDDAWLADQDVAAWTEVPLWGPRATMPATFRHDGPGAAAAHDAGLVWRPLADTVADTWSWMRTLPGGWVPSSRTPGLAPNRERALLAAWHARPGGDGGT